MLNAIFAEFIKLKRSGLLFFVVLAGVLPSLVRLIQYRLGQGQTGAGSSVAGQSVLNVSGTGDWISFVSSKQELSMLMIFVAVVMSASFLFSMEYRYGTAASIFTTHTSRIKGYLAKLSLLYTVIGILLAASAVSEILAGLAMFGEWMPAGLPERFAGAYLWQILLYCLVATIVALFAVWTKKFVLSSVLVFGYLILVFPWHLKGNPYILPFMTPTVMAARVFGSSNYIYSNYYPGEKPELAAAVLLLAVIAAIAAVLGVICYRKQELTN